MAAMAVTNHVHVRYGSEADARTAKRRARFTLNSDRESTFLQKVMSALPLQADMCGALAHVRAKSGHSSHQFDKFIGTAEQRHLG
jgi:hypothetical protein